MSWRTGEQYTRGGWSFLGGYYRMECEHEVVYEQKNATKERGATKNKLMGR